MYRSRHPWCASSLRPRHHRDRLDPEELGGHAGRSCCGCILVILLPFVGMILYFLMGPGRRTVI